MLVMPHSMVMRAKVLRAPAPQVQSPQGEFLGVYWSDGDFTTTVARRMPDACSSPPVFPAVEGLLMAILMGIAVHTYTVYN